mmetsp:Transcript_33237/g.106695  ORF Transcript_33237/g.106695 Transcript_33237/m.106695 type:complete len:267 (-) Transcript_33237:299-1099(-)
MWWPRGGEIGNPPPPRAAAPEPPPTPPFALGRRAGRRRAAAPPLRRARVLRAAGGRAGAAAAVLRAGRGVLARGAPAGLRLLRPLVPHARGGGSRRRAALLARGARRRARAHGAAAARAARVRAGGAARLRHRRGHAVCVRGHRAPRALRRRRRLRAGCALLLLCVAGRRAVRHKDHRRHAGDSHGSHLLPHAPAAQSEARPRRLLARQLLARPERRSDAAARGGVPALRGRHALAGAPVRRVCGAGGPPPRPLESRPVVLQPEVL